MSLHYPSFVATDVGPSSCTLRRAVRASEKVAFNKVGYITEDVQTNALRRGRVAWLCEERVKDRPLKKVLLSAGSLLREEIWRYGL